MFFMTPCPTMDAGENSKVTKLWRNCEQQYKFFSHSITAFYAKPRTYLVKLECKKHLAVDAPETEIVKAKRSKTLATKSGDSCELSGNFYEDFELKSDAESSCQSLDDVDVSDNEQCIDELFHDEVVRKKLELLAVIVGVNNKEPGFVLMKVVTVLKDLKRRYGLMNVPSF